MPYDHFEHRHRFAAWAAARAAQRGFTSVENLRTAIETSGIVTFVRAPASLATNAKQFDAKHRAWCAAIVRNLEQKAVANTTFGRAAKLVAVYLKSMVVLGPDGETSLAAVAHPPIDRLLLQNLAASEVDSPHRAHWRNTNWTKLDERSYGTLITQLRATLADGVPFWTLERCWSVTPNG